MKDFNGTKGEWEWTIKDGNREISLGTQKQKMISIHQKEYNNNTDNSVVYTEDIKDTSIAGIWSIEEEDICNAKLIAAAPEMLQLLQEMDGFLRPLVKGEKSYIKTGGMYHERMKELLETILS